LRAHSPLQSLEPNERADEDKIRRRKADQELLKRQVRGKQRARDHRTDDRGDAAAEERASATTATIVMAVALNPGVPR